MNDRLRIYYNSESDNKEAIIDIEGFIGESWWRDEGEKENSNKRIKKELNDIKAINAARITVNIHSLGGDVDHAFAIYDALKDHPATIITKITGMCASAATIIMMAGDERKMSNNALILIHKCSSYIWGNENEIQAELNSQKTVNERAVNLYVENNKKNEKEIKDLMEENNGNGKWITAKEAENIGLITNIYNDNKAKKAAVFSREQFNDSKLPNLPVGYEHFIEKETNNSILERIENLITCKFQKLENKFINNKNQIEMNKLFPLLVALCALGNDFKFDKDKGVTFDEDKLKIIEDELRKASDLQTEKKTLEDKIKDLETEKTTLTAKVNDLQKIADSTPANNGKIDGTDPNDEPKTYSDKMKKDKYYNDIANEFGLTI
jgi:ATP-dependent protease ClpP protease subunit